MSRYLNMPGPVYIESCGIIASRGEVHQMDPAMRCFIDTWSAYQQIDDLESLQELHYPGGALHSSETVDLCRHFTMSGPESNVTLVYVHRGHHRECKTPLLQVLLARLTPRLRVHGLRVEQGPLPLDIVLFAVAVLRECGRCIIIRDNAIRLGTTRVVSANDTHYLVLSRSKGCWAVDSILLLDEDPGFPSRMATLLLDEFSTDDHRGARSLSLASRTTTNRLGIISIIRVGHNDARAPTDESRPVSSTASVP